MLKQWRVLHCLRERQRCWTFHRIPDIEEIEAPVNSEYGDAEGAKGGDDHKSVSEAVNPPYFLLSPTQQGNYRLPVWKKTGDLLSEETKPQVH